MKLWLKIFIAMVLGCITGAILGPYAIYFKPLGTIFLNMIKMIIVLLILSSMTSGITNIHDPKKLGRLGIKTIGTYITTTLIAVSIGLTVATWLQLGEGLNMQATEYTIAKPPAISEILISIIPENPIESLVKGNILQIIFFAVFLGLAINFSGEKGKPLKSFFDSLADVMYRLTSIIMEFSPIGIFGIMAWVAGTFGWSLILPLLKFLLSYYFACVLMIAVYCLILKFIARLKVVNFVKGMGDALMTAFSTCSSAASLPVAMHCAQENLGVSKEISSFVFPLGITFNMNGSSIFQAMCAVFIAAAYGIPLDLNSYLTILLTASLSSIGTSGVPGSGLIMLSAVLSSVGLPLEGLALLVAIDRLRDMMTTTLNIFGDAAVTVLIAKKEGELNEHQYQHMAEPQRQAT